MCMSLPMSVLKPSNTAAADTANPTLLPFKSSTLYSSHYCYCWWFLSGITAVYIEGRSVCPPLMLLTAPLHYCCHFTVVLFICLTLLLLMVPSRHVSFILSQTTREQQWFNFYPPTIVWVILALILPMRCVVIKTLLVRIVHPYSCEPREQNNIRDVSTSQTSRDIFKLHTVTHRKIININQSFNQRVTRTRAATVTLLYLYMSAYLQ